MPKESGDEPAAKKSKSDKIETEMVTMKRVAKFETLKASLDIDWSKLTKKQLKKISYVYFAVRG